MQGISHWTVFNRVTGKTTTYKSGPAASRAADRMDNAYGAICCTRRAHWIEVTETPDARAYRCTPASIAMEHAAEMAACGVVS